MKAKTLLIAAATLAVGVISSQAQSNVYSANIVGYYNTTIPVNGFALIANQLDVGDGTNGIAQVFGSGLVSDPNAITNTVIYCFNTNSQTFQTLYYFTAADIANLNGDPTVSNWQTGFYLSDYATYLNNPLPPGQAAFLYNPSQSAVTATVVGTVPQKTNVTTIYPGYNLYGVAAPVSTNLCSPLINFQGSSDPNAITNDLLYVWSPSSQTFQTLNYFTATDIANLNGDPTVSNWQTGFYLSDYSTLIDVTPSAGSAFFIFHPGSGAETWTNTFSF